MQKLFINEMHVHSRLSHPHIVELVDFRQDRQNCYLIMELFKSWSLRQVLDKFYRKQQSIPLNLCLKIIRDVALALNYLQDLTHESGENLNIIHCDLSPENILINKQGFTKICDFGLAQSLLSTNCGFESGFSAGKLSYMSPEQATGKTLTFNSDIYSLILCLAEMLLCPKYRYSPADNALKRAQFALKILKKEVWIPKNIVQFVERGLNKNPMKRYTSSWEFKEASQNLYNEYRTNMPVEALFESLNTEPEGIKYKDTSSNTLNIKEKLLRLLSQKPFFAFIFAHRFKHC